MNCISDIVWYASLKNVLAGKTLIKLLATYRGSTKYLRAIYKLGYVKRGSTAFKVPKDGCGVPSAARALLGPEGLLMR